MRDDAIQAIAMVTPPPLPPSLPPSFLWDALTKSEHPGWCVAMQTSPSARLNISMQEVRSPPPPSLTPIPLVKVKRRKRSWGVWGGGSEAWWTHRRLAFALSLWCIERKPQSSPCMPEGVFYGSVCRLLLLTQTRK